MSYADVLDMPFDEYIMALYLNEIEQLLHTEEGREILKDNIRYSICDTDVEGLKRIGGAKHV